MMLEWLDQTETRRGAAMIHRAVEQVFSEPRNRTRDLATVPENALTTRQMGGLVTKRIIEMEG